MIGNFALLWGVLGLVVTAEFEDDDTIVWEFSLLRPVRIFLAGPIVWFLVLIQT